MTVPGSDATTLALDVLDHRIDVDLGAVPAADRSGLVEPWSRCRDRTGRPADVRWTVAVGEAGPGVDLAAPTVGALAEQLTTRVTLSALQARRGELLMLHAGAVADPVTGAVVAYVGASGAGKTTASLALGRELAYLSDETTALRDDLTVVPYPKPLSLVRPGTHHRKDQVGPDQLGLRTPSGTPLRLVALVLLDRDPSLPADAPARLEQVGMADVAPQLLGQVSYLADPPRPLHRVQALLDACGGLLRVTYREAATLPALFRELLDDEGARRRLAEPRHLATTPTTEPRAPGPVPAGTWARLPTLDVLDDDGALVVLREDTVTVLDGIGPTLHAALAAPATESELVDAVVAAHGTPEDGDPVQLVRSALAEMLQRGVVTRSRTAGCTPG